MAAVRRRKIRNALAKRSSIKTVPGQRINVAVLGVAVLIGVLLHGVPRVVGVDDTFTQDDWQGGAVVGSATKTGYTRYASTDGNVVTSTIGQASLVYTSSSQQRSTKTEFDGSGSNVACFNGGDPCGAAGTNTTRSQSSGSDDGSVVLDGDITWTAKAAAPFAVGKGGGFVYDGTQYMYALAGNDTKKFMRYNTVSNAWTTLSDYPGALAVGNGGAIAYARVGATGYVYASHGNGTNKIYRFNTATLAWETSTVANSGEGFSQGGSLTWDGGNVLYHVKGSGVRLEKYTISSNSWTRLADAPLTISEGSSAAYSNGLLYVAPAGTTDVWAYSPSTNAWSKDTTSTASDLPIATDFGGSLTTAFGTMYGLSGGSSGKFFYRSGNQQWTEVAPALITMGRGGSLVFDGRTFYATKGGGTTALYVLKTFPASGTYRSPTIDFGSGQRYATVTWDAAIPAGTGVTLQLRAGQNGTSWSAWRPSAAITVTNGTNGSASLNEADLNGQRYVQYRLVFNRGTNPPVGIIPTVSRVSIAYSSYRAIGTLISSPYQMGTTTQGPVVKQVRWWEAIPTSSNTKVSLQLRTKSSSSFISADPWYGSGGVGETFTGTNVGCTKGTTIKEVVNGTNAYEVVCTVSASSPINTYGISHVQYQILLESLDQGATPYITKVFIDYGLNSPPRVASVGASQSTDGVVTVNYSLSDDDGSDSVFDVGLFYDVGLRLLEGVSDQSATLTVDSGNYALNSLVPSEGVVLIGNEQILYRYVVGNSFARNPVTDEALQRGALFSTASSHDSGDIVWVRATDSQIASLINRTAYATSAGFADVGSGVARGSHTIRWRPAFDLIGNVYQVGRNIRVVANDHASVNNTGGDTIATDFTLDTKAPNIGATPVIFASSSAIKQTSTGLKTSVRSVTLSIAPPTTTDDNPSGNKYALCSYLTSDAPCTVPGSEALRTYSGATESVSWTFPVDGPQAVRIAAVDPVGNVSAAGEARVIVDTTKPPAPTGFSGQDASNETVGALAYVNWTPLDPVNVQDGSGSSDFVRYDIYRDNMPLPCPSSTTFCLKVSIPNITTKSYADDSVTAGVAHRYKIIAVDNIGNESSDLASAPATAPITPTPAGAPPPTPPAITGSRVVSYDTNSAKIEWYTDKLSDATVVYAATETAPTLPNGYSGYPTQGDATLKTGLHQVTLVGLASSTRYYVQVRSATPGNTTAGVYPASSSDSLLTFTTEAVPPPIVPTFVGTPSVVPSERSATFSWSTDKQADSFVEYGTSSALGNYYGSRDIAYSHSVSVPGLQPNTTYYYRLRSAIPGQGENAYPSTTGTSQFKTLVETEDNVPPEPKNIQSPIISDTTALMRWHTDEVAQHFVEFWLEDDSTTVRTLPANLDAPSNDASVLLTDLEPETTYVYQVASRDAAGNIGRSPQQPPFTTLSNPRYASNPDITNVRNDQPSATTATIYFVTDQPTKVTVRYSSESDATPYARSQVFPAFVEGEHAVTLLGLSAGTAYAYQVEATNPSDRTSKSSACEGTPDTCTFTTALQQGPLPEIIVPSIVITKDADNPNIVTIAWRTAAPGNSLVEFGYDAVNGAPQYGRTFGFVRDNTADHQVTLPSDLLEGKTYYFRLHTRDTTNQLAVFPVTADLSDTTCHDPNPAPATCKNPTFGTVDSGTIQIAEAKAPPVITGVGTLLVTDVKVVIGWTTDKPANSEVFLGTSSNFAAEATKTDATLTTTHAITIDGLVAKTKYYFKIASTDRNEQRQPDDNGGEGYTFTTNAGTGSDDEDGNRFDSQTDVVPPSIQQLQVTDIGDHNATVTWTTNEVATSIVQYGETTAYGELAGDSTNFVTEHSVRLTQLIGGTTYHFVAVSYDASGNFSLSRDTTFTTTGKRGEEPPLEEEDLLDEEDDETEIDEEKEDETADDEKDLTDVEKRIQELSTEKQLSLEKIIELLQGYSEEDAAKLLDAVGLQLVAPPAFVGGAPRVVVTTETATITWTTDKPSDSRVAFAAEEDYRPSADDPYRSEVGDTETFSTEHEVILTNLEPNTVYHYQLRSRERVGRTARSRDRAFKTLPLQPEMTGLRIANVTENTITLAWKTNVPTKSVVDYTDLTSGERRSQGEPQFLTLHSFAIRNLNGDTPYKLTVRGEDESGLVVTSRELTTRTARDDVAPIIEQVRTEVSLTADEKGTAQAIITWRTDEPATSRVLYEEGVTVRDEFANTPEGSTELQLSHVVVLGRLRPATVYRFRVVSQDRSGNEATSRDFTLLTPQQRQSVLGIIVSNFEETFGFLRFLGWAR